MKLIRRHPWLTLLIVIVLSGATILYYTKLHQETPNWVTTAVDTGTVRELVSISGFVEAKQQAELGFPSIGTVTGVLVEEGSQVKTGDVLATLAATELVEERTAAMNGLIAAKAIYERLRAGPRSEILAQADSRVESATTDLARITKEENTRVASARASLLSSDLAATTIDMDEGSTPPTVSGTYSCRTEGNYKIEVYGSNSRSGYSYRYSGLETGTDIAAIEQPAPLGKCGLYLQFAADQVYQGSQWIIDIPNRRGSNYTTLQNALTLAETQSNNAISRARDTLRAAERDSAVLVAPTRSEELAEAKARVNEAEARVRAIDARIADRSIVAPFSGTIIDVSVVTGETVSNTPVITLLSNDAFKLTVRIPEIDIRKIKLDQSVQAIFDASPTETLTGKISYVSPVATQIDGVAYFEATVNIDNIPEWVRAGLNADVDVIIAEQVNTTRLPRRFVSIDENGRSTVSVLNNDRTATTSIEVLFIGNDGFVAISGLANGTSVVAP